MSAPFTPEQEARVREIAAQVVEAASNSAVKVSMDALLRANERAEARLADHPPARRRKRRGGPQDA